MGRDLALTSPQMRGSDVVHLQRALNARLAARHQGMIHVDGVYGAESEHAVRTVSWALGFQPHHPAASQSVVRLIEHPAMRNPAELKRAHDRQVAQARTGGGLGLGAIVGHAMQFIGLHEDPAGSNQGHPHPSDWEIDLFGFDAIEWCGCFAGNMMMLAGGHVTNRVGYCPSIVADAMGKTDGFMEWQSDHRNGVGPGWLVLYDWNNDGTADHVGIVKSIHANGLIAIEGNTGGREPQWSGMVDEVSRDYTFTLGYAKPRVL